MRRSTSRFLALLLALQSVTACASDTTTAVPAGDPAAPKPIPQPSPAFPPLERPGTIYNRATPDPDFAGASRYVIYGDSTFILEYLVPTTSTGVADFTGRYVRADSIIKFSFDGSNVALGPWLATGTVHTDSTIAVVYNAAMSASDFANGVYRSPAPLPGDVPSTARIYLVNADGSGVTRLTTGGSPAWSPDGQRIALNRSGNIYVIDATGANEIQLVAGASPTWSPDGKRIAFTSSEGIAVMNADGSGVTTLVRHGFRTDTYAPWDMGVGNPAWSPDGAHIAFEHFGDGDIQPSQIYIMGADGSQVRLATTASNGFRYAESDPSWSPDGSKIFFWSYGFGIAAVASDGGQPTSIYAHFPEVAYDAKPTSSPDGRTLAFTEHNATAGFTWTGTTVWTMSSTGSGLQALIPAGYDASWSPKGGRIAFVSTSDK
jgi:Tol biopolymer transport system component